jgi:recombination protein RecA
MKKETKEEGDKVEAAMAQLQKKYGNDVLMELSRDTDFKVEWFSTGSFALDEVIGKGLPKGRIIEVFGAESSGKSTMSLFLMAQIQKAGGRVALIDAENAFDGAYASNIGLDISKLLVSQPQTLEEAFDIMKALIDTGEMDMIVVDSVSALVPKSAFESEEMLKDTMAVQARLMSKGLPLLSGPISKTKTILIFINQIRDKVGVFYGAKTTTSGGRALKFYSSVRLEVAKGGKLEGKGDVQIGNEIIVKAAKNKVGFPWKAAKIDLYYARGLDLHADTLDFGEKVGIIKKVGITYSYDNIVLGVGREKARQTLVEDEILYQKIREAITKKNDEK